MLLQAPSIQSMFWHFLLPPMCSESGMRIPSLLTHQHRPLFRPFDGLHWNETIRPCTPCHHFSPLFSSPPLPPLGNNEAVLKSDFFSPPFFVYYILLAIVHYGLAGLPRGTWWINGGRKDRGFGWGNTRVGDEQMF